MNVAEAAQGGSRLDLLVALRDRIAVAVADPDCPKRDLSSLSLRLVQLTEEIESAKASAGEDDLGAAISTPDEPL